MKEYAAAAKELFGLISAMFSPKAIRARQSIYRNNQRKKALKYAAKCKLIDREIKVLRNGKKRTQEVITKIIALENKKFKYWDKFDRLLIEE